MRFFTECPLARATVRLDSFPASSFVIPNNLTVIIDTHSSEVRRPSSSAYYLVYVPDLPPAFDTSHTSVKLIARSIALHIS